ncbi:JAB domain-containing protein [Ktedonobacter robiniae]|uniref:JAB domain-containing protein n=1 Tax=Ktedonobacter robiniae TaxID=2778365 RepID=UPI001916B158|nr:JAB domain-containing protein [Ktedonobacter robiniae]
MHILILDTKNRVVEHAKRYKGTVNSSVLRSSEVFRPAVVRNCPTEVRARESRSLQAGEEPPEGARRPLLMGWGQRAVSRSGRRSQCYGRSAGKSGEAHR